MILHMLDHLPAATRSIFLFPTIERMSDSPKGRWVTPALRVIRWVVPAVVALLPQAIVQRLLRWHLGDSETFMTEACQQMIAYSPLTNILHMAHQEMRDVKTADYQLIDRHQKQIWFYYGEDDHWCPQSYYRDMKERFPHAEITLCQHGMPHAFCLEWGSLMSQLIKEWMRVHSILDFTD